MRAVSSTKAVSQGHNVQSVRHHANNNDYYYNHHWLPLLIFSYESMRTSVPDSYSATERNMDLYIYGWRRGQRYVWRHTRVDKSITNEDVGSDNE